MGWDGMGWDGMGWDGMGWKERERGKRSGDKGGREEYTSYLSLEVNEKQGKTEEEKTSRR
jgi:hypothetical protein